MRAVLFLAILPFLAGCGDTSVDPVELGPDLSLAEIKGTKLAGGLYGNLPPAVTRDTQQVVFAGGLSDRLIIVNAKTDAIRTQEVGQGLHGVAGVGTDIYYVQETDSTRYTLFRWRDNISTPIFDNSALLAVQWPADGVAAVGSADGSTVAIVGRPDSLYLLDPTTNERTFVRDGCDGVVAMSPDGGAVMCLQRTTRTYIAYSTATGAVRTDIVIPADVATRAHEVRWFATGVRVLYAESGRYAIFDEATGQRVTLGDIIVAPSTLGLAQTAWSPDGGRVAFWQNYCAQKAGDECVKYQSFLMIHDQQLGGLRREAIHTLPTGVRTGAAVAFSVSGHKLYYVVGTDLYVIDV